MEFPDNWPATLPWLQFLALTGWTPSDLSRPLAAGAPGVDDNDIQVELGWNAFHKFLNSASHPGNGDLQAMASFVLGQTFSLRYPQVPNTPSLSIPMLATGLAKYVPEAYRGEHFATADLILHGSKGELGKASFRLLVYIMVNKLGAFGIMGNENLKGEDREKLDAIVTSIFRSFVRQHPKEGQEILSHKDPTTTAMAESLFGAAIRLLSPELVALLAPIIRHDLIPIRGRREDREIPCFSQPIDFWHHMSPLTPLQYALWHGDVEIVEILLKAGADPNIAPDMGLEPPDLSPLEIACMVNEKVKSLELARLLIAWGAEVHRESGRLSPLLVAAERGHPELLKLLLENGANVHHTYDWGGSRYVLLDLVVDSGCEESLSIVLDRTMIPNIKQSHLLMCLIRRMWARRILGISKVKMLLGRLKHVNGKMTSGETILLSAVRSRRLDVCQLLVQRGARPDPRRRSWRWDQAPTPLQLAARYGDSRIVTLLLDHGAQVNRRTAHQMCSKHWAWKPNLRSALQTALYYGQKAVANILIRAGATFGQEELDAATNSFRMRNLMDTIGRALRPDEKQSLLRSALNHANQTLVLDLLGTNVNFGEEEIMRVAELNWNRVTSRILRGKINLSLPFQTGGASLLETSISFGNGLLVDAMLRLDGLTSDAGALCAALWKGQDSLTRRLIEKWRRGSDKTLEGTAVGIAMFLSEKQLLRSLLDAGLDATECYLPDSFYDIQKKTARTALEHGWWRDSKVKKGSPLHFALRNKAMDILRLAQPYIRTVPFAILSDAVRFSSPEIVRLLFETPYPADQHDDWDRVWDQSNGTLLQMAAGRGNTDIIQLVLDAGEDVNETFCTGKYIHTALQLAAAGGHVESVKMLLQAGADVNKPPTALDCVDLKSLRGVEVRDSLQSAVSSGNPELVKLMLDAGAEFDAAAYAINGATALQVACIKGYIGIAKLLVDGGADVNGPAAQHRGRTALEGAAEYGRLDIIQLLLASGVRLDGEYTRQYLRAVKFAKDVGHNAVALLIEAHRRSLGPTTEEASAPLPRRAESTGEMVQNRDLTHLDASEPEIPDLPSPDHCDRPYCAWDTDSGLDEMLAEDSESSGDFSGDVSETEDSEVEPTTSGASGPDCDDEDEDWPSD